MKSYYICPPPSPRFAVIVPTNLFVAVFYVIFTSLLLTLAFVVRYSLPCSVIIKPIFFCVKQLLILFCG